MREFLNIIGNSLILDDIFDRHRIKELANCLSQTRFQARIKIQNNNPLSFKKLQCFDAVDLNDQPTMNVLKKSV